MNANKLLPYRFPGKKKLASSTLLPPIVTSNKNIVTSNKNIETNIKNTEPQKV
jgi:hypothetical protein